MGRGRNAGHPAPLPRPLYNGVIPVRFPCSCIHMTILISLALPH